MAKKRKTVVVNNPEAGGLFSHEAESALIQYLSRSPETDDVLRKVGIARYKLRALMTDDEIYQCIEKRQDKLEGTNFRIEPNDSSESIIITELIKKWWSEILIGTQNARWYGYSVLEAVYDKKALHIGDKGIITPYLGLAWIGEKPMQWFEPKNDGRLMMRKDSFGVEQEVDQRLKFFLTQCKATYEQPYGEALLSRLYWVWFFKTNAFKFWAKFVERFGNPLLKGKSIDNKAMRKALLEAHASAVIAIDRSDEVEIVSAQGVGAGGSSAFESFDKTLEKRIQKVILGGTLTSGTDGSGSRALGEVHLQVEKNKLGADIRMITSTVQALIDALCALNGWNRHEIIIGEEKSLEAAKAERDAKLKNAGANLTPQYFLREYGLQEGDVADIQLSSPHTQFTALPKTAFSFKASTNKLSAAQLEVEELTDGQVELELLNQDQIKKLVAESDGPESLAFNLMQLLPGITHSHFKANLDQALYAGDVLGYMTAQGE